MRPPDESFREKNRLERIRFVKLSAEWVRAVPNEVWSAQQKKFIDAQLANRRNYPLSKEQYLYMIDKARSLSDRRKGSPPMPPL
ncbi:MAG: hypothetical protein JXA44_00005, partial [Methanospirillaceae archaeon]|nr:hypothetical protein [Methanospirillaceae archaeon]